MKNGKVDVQIKSGRAKSDFQEMWENSDCEISINVCTCVAFVTKTTTNEYC